MEDDLVRQLLSAPAEERRAATKMLGRLGTEAAVEALLALAQDGDASLDDQLLAIECLGNTRSPAALAYAQALCCETIREVPTTYIAYSGGDMREVVCFDEEHFCAAAAGALRFALTYIVQLDEVTPNGEWLRRRSEEDIAADRESIPKSREAFRVVHETLRKLT
jgi:hypothetical protein